MILPFTGGRVSSAQLKAVAKAVSELADDFADLTTRQEIQLPDIPADRSPEILGFLQAAGLSSADSAASVVSSAPENSRDPLGVWEQAEGNLFTLGVSVLAGRLTGNQTRKTADVAERYGDGSLLLTLRQNLLIPNIPKEKVAQALESLDTAGLRVHASAFGRGLVVCGRGNRVRAQELVFHLEKQVPLEGIFRIHWSALPCDCPESPVADVRVEGERLLHLALGGFVVRDIPAGQLKIRFEQLLAGYKRKRKEEEAFSDFCRRAGEEELARLLSDDVEAKRSP